jgi:hypothetical protein
MTQSEQMQAVEKRAHDARLTMGDLLKMAGVAHSTWSRAKARGYIRARTIKRVEDTLDWYEDQQRDDGTPRAVVA